MRKFLSAFSFVIYVMFELSTTTALAKDKLSNDVSDQDSIPVLAEIFIEGKKKKMRVSNDTTVFNVSAFRDGSEKKIEELIARLPGMSVNPDNGIISYQGRTVEAVKIDGFDLLGSNYVTGTRNISVELIEEIEAVSNDPDNPLLKSIQTNGKMILNLKTKKKTASTDGEISLGAGKRDDHITPVDAHVHLLKLSTRLKIFNIGSFNNRGVNNGSFNYFRSAPQSEVAEDQQAFTESLFDPLLPFIPIDHHRYNINDMGMLNGNFLVQPGNKNSSLRMNLFLMKDRQYGGYRQMSSYDSGLRTSSTSDVFSSVGQINNGEGEMEWTKLLTPKIWLKYKANINYRNNHSGFTQILNDTLMVDGRFAGRQSFHAHEFDFTFRTSNRFVMRSILKLSQHRLEEDFAYQSGSHTQFFDAEQSQYTKTQTSALDYQHHITVIQKNKTFEFHSGIRYFSSPFTSWQGEEKESLSGLNISFNNRQHQYHSVFYQTAGITIVKNNFRFSGKAAIHFHSFSWLSQYREKQYQTNGVPEVEVTIAKKLGPVVSWVNKLVMVNQPVSLKPYMYQPIIVSPRAILLHDIAPQLQTVIHLNSLLIYQNSFRQQYAQIGLQHITTDKSVVAGLEIDERRIVTRSMAVAVPQKRWQANGRYEIFVRPLNASFVADADAAHHNYYNQVNAKTIRENFSENISIGMQYKTAFRFPVNIVYRFSLSNTVVHTERASSSSNKTIHHVFDLICRKGKKIFGQVTADCFRTDIVGNQSLLFVDFLMHYKPIKKHYMFTLVGKNVLNRLYFSQRQVSDYGMVLSQTRLLPGYLMFQVEYRF